MACNSRLRAWAKLIAGFAMIFIFIFVVMPLVSGIPAVEEMLESNRRYNIPAGTLYYSETPQFGNADNFMNNSKNYKSNRNLSKHSK
jgi:hypothetical protein